MTYYTAIQRPNWIPALIGATGLALAGLFPIISPDIHAYLSIGREIAQDTYFFTTNRIWDEEFAQQWRSQSWLSSVLFWNLYQLGGHSLLIICRALLLGLMGVVLVWRASATQGADWVCCVHMLWMVPACRMRLTMNPHLFGYIMTAILLLGLSRLTMIKPGRDRTLWFVGIVTMQVAWVNLHSSFFLALVVVGIYLVVYLWYPDERSLLFRLLLLMTIASCLTPWGPALLIRAYHQMIASPLFQIFDELSCFTSGQLPWLLTSIGATGFLFVFGSRANFRVGLNGWASLCIALLLFAMTLRSLRFVPYALLVASPLIGEGVSLTLTGLSASLKKAAVWVGLGTSLWFVPLASLSLSPKQPIGWKSVKPVLYHTMEKPLPHFSKTFLSDQNTQQDSADTEINKVISKSKDPTLIDNKNTVQQPQRHITTLKESICHPFIVQEKQPSLIKTTKD